MVKIVSQALVVADGHNEGTEAAMWLNSCFARCWSLLLWCALPLSAAEPVAYPTALRIARSFNPDFPENVASIPPQFVLATDNDQWVVGLSIKTVPGRFAIFRLNADGTADTAFQSVFSDPVWSLSDLAALPDGDFLATTTGGVDLRSGAWGELHHLTAAGLLGPHFADYAPKYARITLDPAGRIILWGTAETVSPFQGQPGFLRPGITRLLAAGTADAGFDPNDNIRARSVLALGLQSTGRIVLSLASTATEPARFLRLRDDGSTDGSFTTGTGFDGAVLALAIQPDDRIIAVGNFTRYRGASVPGLVRINGDGSHDPTFQAGSGFDLPPTGILTPSDGQILFWGDFTEYRGTSVTGLARVSAGGTLDTTLTIDGSQTAIANVRSWATAADGDVLVIAAEPQTSSAVRLHRLEPAAKPLISMQPVAQSVTAGQSTVFQVQASGPAPLTYQWQHDGKDIPGATGDTYTLPGAQAFQTGRYTVVVSGSGYSVTSAVATLAVQTPPPSNARLLNLSTRAFCRTGDGVLVPGFVVRGPGDKRLLIRAVGPTLEQDPFRVESTLPNPRMQLMRRNTFTGSFDVVAANDDWGTNSNPADTSSTAARLFAFELADAREAALLLDVSAGEYTVIADDAAGATGAAIVEIYDADESATGAEVVNISNRGFAGAGEQVMIPGFVISSEGAKTVLLRVVGPTLAAAPFNVSGTMLDPAMWVYRSDADGGSTLLFSNDDWNDVPQPAVTAAVAQQVLAFPLPPDSRDAAVVATLPPGVYTIHGAAADQTSSGVVLVELYLVE